MSEQAEVKLKPVVRFREFPFGTIHDPSMREFTSPVPWPNQDRVTAYLRQGYTIGILMGGSLHDYFDPAREANPIINGVMEVGCAPMTDGVWYWPAGLIYFIETYNVRVPREFVEHAARQNWRIDQDKVAGIAYDYNSGYFERVP